MSYAFSSAKSTFGTLQEKINQSDFINRKKKKNLFCNNQTVCNRLAVLNNANKCNVFSTNKYNLIIGQYSKTDLKNVCVISLGSPPTEHCSDLNPCNPCQTTAQVPIVISSSATPLHETHTLDPLGELFGNSQCGELNYNKYMAPY